MQTRTIKELLELMLEHQGYFLTGLCMWSISLYHFKIINCEEEKILYRYITFHRPINLRYFNDYYWEKCDIKPRLHWIKKHIKKNS